MLALLGIGVVAVLAIGYASYGKWVARQIGVDNSRVTPANKINDGEDFVPTKPFYLFGQHFSAIAAAGPIVGPILACQAWGWLPCLVWIAYGVVLIGAVHDFATLAASVRHGGSTIAEVTKNELGSGAGIAIRAFIWIALIYVIVAFTDITAGTFVAGGQELAGRPTDFHPGGAVAAAAVMYLTLSVVLGIVQRFLKPALWLATVIFVPATLVVVWLGTKMSTVLIADAQTWALIIVGYCCVASVAPVWLLLQPRGYLGGFVLMLALGLGIVGVLFGGYDIAQPAFAGFSAPNVGMMLPFLFVTIACGACSGFHGLVCSGTTSKQVDKEGHMHPVGYGGMLAEGFVAFIALVTIMIVAPADVGTLKPGTIYGNGIGRFLTLIIGEQHMPFAITFGAMAFSTFVFDTLDMCLRLGRYLLQELFGWKTKPGAAIATLLTAAVPTLFLLCSPAGSWRRFWIVFGASNQLLAALTLLTITIWLYRARRRIAFTLFPMLFVLAITLWSLLSIAAQSLETGTGIELINAVVALVMVGLATFLVVRALTTARAVSGSTSKRRV